MTPQQITLFGLLTALALVLSFFDEKIPLLNGFIPGFKLGLANTVLIFAVYMMSWKTSVMLMLSKVLLTSLLFGMNMFWVRFGGGAVSLLVMQLLKKKPGGGLLAVAVIAALVLVQLIISQSKAVWIMILISAVCIACIVSFIAVYKGILPRIVATSICGAVAHNFGQTVAARLKTYIPPQLWITYFPGIVIIGAIVGCMTGIVADRVIRLMKTHSAVQ